MFHLNKWNRGSPTLRAIGDLTPKGCLLALTLGRESNSFPNSKSFVQNSVQKSFKYNLWTVFDQKRKYFQKPEVTIVWVKRKHFWQFYVGGAHVLRKKIPETCRFFHEMSAIQFFFMARAPQVENENPIKVPNDPQFLKVPQECRKRPVTHDSLFIMEGASLNCPVCPFHDLSDSNTFHLSHVPTQKKREPEPNYMYIPRSNLKKIQIWKRISSTERLYPLLT